MHRVTNTNFNEYYLKIEESIKNASFIAIDAEFSGLRSTNAEDYSDESLFDSVRERYAKLRRNIEPFIALQFGLTTFTRVKHANEYRTECFAFHLIPRALPTRNRLFSVQTSSIEFLSFHKFDFNEFARDAISYLNEEEEVRLAKDLEGSLFDRNLRDSDYGDEAEKCFETVRKWLENADERGNGDALRIRTSGYPASYNLQKELRAAFPNLRTRTVATDEFLVDETSPNASPNSEESDEDSSLDRELLDHYKGFSKIFQLLRRLKKPLVGHNLLLDLMYTHQQFYRPLPGDYESFKRNINRLFPTVYDTKYLSFRMKDLPDRESLKSNVLSDLYGYFKDGPGHCSILNAPRVVPPGEEKFHNAAWDSFCTGYCFVRMAHIFAVNRLSKIADLRELTNTEIMFAVQGYVNRINLIRADQSFSQLDGPDPVSTRPGWLLVRSDPGSNGDRATTSQIARILSPFGVVDVRRFSKNAVLVAVPNYRAARVILEHFRKEPKLKIVPYDPSRHSAYGTIKAVARLGSLFLSVAVVCAWILGRGEISKS